MKRFDFNEINPNYKGKGEKTLVELIKAVVNRINEQWENSILFDLENGDMPLVYEFDDVIRMIELLKRITTQY